jgi:hypothetical protein
MKELNTGFEKTNLEGRSMSSFQTKAGIVITEIWLAWLEPFMWSK